jgi:hypothetical protein
MLRIIESPFSAAVRSEEVRGKRRAVLGHMVIGYDGVIVW